MTTKVDSLVDRYLKDLETELRACPATADGRSSTRSASTSPRPAPP